MTAVTAPPRLLLSGLARALTEPANDMPAQRAFVASLFGMAA